MKRMITAADLFCGAGGTSTGLVRACEKMGFNLDLVAVNHWDIAISTHTKNHPYARHINAPIDSIKPLEVFPDGRLNLLVASPECTHFSNARGGKPMSDQRRATAWDILPWLEKLYVDNLLIENVKEFRTWGPLGADGRPMKSKKGATYDAFLRAVESLGYRVEDKVLNAANYGDPTTRERLFVIARRGNRKIVWPEPSHSSAQTVVEGLFGDEEATLPWRSAREIIDWSIEGKSIFNRKKPLAPATLRRIAAGLRKFGGDKAKPFLILLRQHCDAISIDEPLPTITTSGSHHALCEPHLIQYNGQSLAHSVDSPVPTIMAQGEKLALIEPVLIGQQSCAAARPVDEPVPTIATQGAISLVQFIVPQFKENGPKSVDDPLGTLTTTSRGVGLCESYVINLSHMGEGEQGHERRVYDADKPMPTITGKGQFGVVEPCGPFLVPFYGEGENQKPRSHSVDEPVPTIPTKVLHGLCEPVVMAIDHGSGDGNPRSVSDPLHTITTKERLGVITTYYGNGDGSSVEEPLPTVTTKDRFGLVLPENTEYGYDIRFRMLQPHELSKAMGFPDGYHFEGNRESVVKQIGNAVCVNMAEALCTQLLKAA